MSTLTRSFAVYVRDASGARIGEANELGMFTLTDRHNGLGTWEMRLPWSHPARALLWQPGHGIEVERTTEVDGEATTVVLASGPLRSARRDSDGIADTATLYGATDVLWIARRRAHPQPASSAPPYSSQAYDVRTGAAETVLKAYVDVHAGPGAIVQRRVPGLTIAADAARGSTVTASARWQPLAELAAGIATRGGLGVRCVGLEVDVYEPTDRSGDGIEFSEERGNLGPFTYTLRSPEATYVYAGGSGTGTSRTIVEGQDPAAAIGWGRSETFIDRRDTATTADIDGSIAETLATSAATSALAADVIDTPTCFYGVHYELGDLVGIDVDGTVVARPVSELTVSITAAGTVVRPFVGEAALAPGTFTLLRRLAAVEADVADLQRYY